MPEAVSSHTTTAPFRQPTSKIDLDVFSDTIREAEALTMMLGALLDQNTGLNQNITQGICNLFGNLVEDFRSIYHDARSQVADGNLQPAFDRAVSLLTPDGKQASDPFSSSNRKLLSDLKDLRKLFKVEGNSFHGLQIQAHALVMGAFDNASAKRGMTKSDLVTLVFIDFLVSDGELQHETVREFKAHAEAQSKDNQLQFDKEIQDRKAQIQAADKGE